MPNINFELNLNKHPKDVVNRSLIAARNVQVSGDNSCLQSEYCIKENDVLKSILTDKYIAGYIPCNKEFILFVAPKTWRTDLDNSPSGITIDLYRIKEQGALKDSRGQWLAPMYRGSFDLSQGKLVYDKFVWHGGKIKGTFTYNIKSHLILAIAESDTYTGDYIPLKTINLGTYDSTENDIDTDLMLDDSQLSLNPEIKIPSISGYDYVNGLAYKGWYYFFIRYKINSIDYTKWYSVGFPILIDEIEKVRLFNYFIKGDTNGGSNKEFCGCGAIDYISSGSNTCNRTVQLNIDNKNNNFKYYQIGIIQSTKDSERAFKTLDLDINITKFLLNFNSLEVYDRDSLLFEKYNYYNVKNVINYKNRLYCSNYKEKEKNVNLSEIASKFKVRIDRQIFDYTGKVADAHSQTTFGFENEGSVTLNTSVLSGSFNVSNYDISGGYLSIENLELGIGACSGAIYDISTAVINNMLIPATKFFRQGTYTIDDISSIFNYLGYNIRITLSSITFNITSYHYDHEDETHEVVGKISFTTNIEFYNTLKNNYPNRLKNTTLLPGETYKFYIHFVNKYGEYSDGLLINGDFELYHDLINSYAKNNDDSSMTIYNEKYNEINKKCYIYYPTIVVLNDEIKETFVASLKNFGVYGFFISYEKFQKTKQFTGILARYDFPYTATGGGESKAPRHIKNTAIADSNSDYKFKFYCTDIDTKDTIDLNFTKLILETNKFAKPTTKQADTKDEIDYDDSCNISDYGTEIIANFPEFYILNASYISAHNFSKGNDYYGSYIELEFENPVGLLNALGLTPEQALTDSSPLENYLCKATLVSDNKNLYLSENKTLIKFSNVFYFDEMNFSRGYVVVDYDHCEYIRIPYGLNGFCTFNTALIYNYNKVILNSGFNTLLTKDYYSYISSDVFEVNGSPDTEKMPSLFRAPMLAYYTYIDYNDCPYESRCFKTLPEIISIRDEAISDESSQAIFTFKHATIVQPMNSVDLFQNKIGSQDNNAKKTYINYKDTFISDFDKRIIRSAPIADESFENSWRIFTSSDYKDITENKGNITNIVALGTTFLIHTEHSLFMLDRDNTLRNGADNSVQLAMPDVFDIDYKEIFASDLGICGLQDSDAWIVDDFGYIFYDNDAHTFYKFGAKKIEAINNTITQFVDKYKPYRIRFAHDAESHRILVNILYLYGNLGLANYVGELTLSYNYQLNKWISVHDYCFDRAFNTKQMLYLIVDRSDDDAILYDITGNLKSQIYLINRKGDIINHFITTAQNLATLENSIYNEFENIRNIHSKLNYYYSTIEIMVNDSYELIKTLEYITWKLYKIKNIHNESTLPNTNPRDILREPYSGMKLRIYNDNVDTGEIYVNVDSEGTKNVSVMDYKRPWWELGNWNFNYLRDIKHKEGNIVDTMSRLYGNYFIIQLVFGGTNEKVEFETLDCKLINNTTI